MEGKVFVPPERASNVVDRLLQAEGEIQKSIAQVQTDCQHKFQLDESVLIFESEVSGVYVIIADHILRVRCKLCSKPDELPSSEVCLCCSGGMVRGDTERITKYSSKVWIKREWNARLYSCRECEFAAVDMEYLGG